MDQHCMNGGKCEPANAIIDHRHCVCEEDYSGPRCSRYCPLDCQNKGYCTVKPRGGALGDQEQTPTYEISDYMCKCFDHFVGDFCEVPYTNCGGKTRCYHGGECISASNEAVFKPCRCPPGYSGTFCEIVLSDYSVDIKKSEFTTARNLTRSSAILVSCFSIISLGWFLWRRKQSRTCSFTEFGEDADEDESAFMDEMKRYSHDGSSQQDYSSHKAFELHLI
jgi:hypothetical protein